MNHLPNSQAQLLQELKTLKEQLADLEKTHQACQRVENQLARERNLLHQIAETSPVGIAVVNLDGQITFANSRAEQILNSAKTTIVQRQYNAPEWHITDYAGRPFPDEALPFQRVQVTGEPVTDVRHAIQWPDGRRVLLSINAAPLVDEAGVLQGVVTAFEDVTARIETERSLERHSTRLEDLVADRTSELSRVNRAYQTLMACNQTIMRATSEENLLQQICRVLVDSGNYRLACIGFPNRKAAQSIRLVAWATSQADNGLDITHISRDDQPNPMSHVIRTGQSCVVRPDWVSTEFEAWYGDAAEQGCISSIILPLVSDDQVIGALAVGTKEAEAFDEQETVLLAGFADNLAYGIMMLRTNAERKRVEQEHHKLSRAVEQSPNTIFITNAEGEIEYANPKFAELSGYSTEEAMGRLPRILDPTLITHDEYVERWHTLLNEGEWRGEFLNRKKNGDAYWEFASISAIKDSDGIITNLVIVKEDITQRKQAEEALHESQRTLAVLMSNLPGMAYRCYNDRQWTMLFVSEGARELTGYAPSDLVNNRTIAYRNLIHEEDQARVWNTVQSAIQLNQSFQITYRIITRDGQEKWIWEQGQSVQPSEDANLVLEGFISDITQRVYAEQAEHEQRQLAEALADNASTISKSLNLDGVLNRILENAGRIVSHEAAHIMLVEYGTARVVGCLGYAERGLRDRMRTTTYSIVNTPFLQQMVDSKQPLIISDTREFPGWIAEPPTDWVDSYAGAPIMLEDEVIGFLNLVSGTAGYFRADSAPWIQTLANQAAIAIRNARWYEQSQERATLLAALNRATHRLRNNDLNLQAVFHTIVVGLVEELEFTLARIWMPDETGTELVLQASAGLHTDLDDRQPIQINTGDHYLSDIARNQRGLVSNHVQEDERFDRAWAEKHGIIAFAGYPLTQDGRLVGVLKVFSRKQIDPIMLDVLTSFVNHAAITVENARLYQELEAYSEYLEQAVEARTKDLERATEHVEAILDSSTDAIVLVRSDGAIKQGNETFYQLFDDPAGDAFGRALTSLVRPEQGEQVRAALRTAIERKRPDRLEVIAQRRDGTTFAADMALSPVVRHDAPTTTAVCSLHDISDRKRIETTLQQALRREVEVSEMRMRFLSIASHDLRNPLAVIQSSMDLLSQYDDRLSSERKQTKYNQIQASINYMVELLDDIITIGRIEAGKLEFNAEPVDLVALCRSILRDFQMSIGSDHTFDFSVSDENINLVLDRKLLRQIISNLLSNAIKYSPAGSTITFTVHCDDEHTTLRISDAGIGIPQADQVRLFEAFHRASNVGPVSGTGLGLAIVKQSVEMHNGTIAFDSKEGVGTTFTVTLPTIFAGQPQERSL